MQILISSYYLDLSGTPTYTLTLYNELVRRGHHVIVYSPQSGKLAYGMNVVTDLDGMSAPDVIIAQQNVCAETLRAKFKRTPMLFSAHGVLPEMEQPPIAKVDWYTAINEDVLANLTTHGVNDKRITIVRDFVDTDRFFPVESLHDYKASRVLFISNFKKWRTFDVIQEACKLAGVELRAIGAPYGRTLEVEHEINLADLVISIGRGVIEAMACGRPVVSFNQMRGDGYLTHDVYQESRTRNFAGAKCRHAFDARGLADEIAKYSPVDGLVNRGIAIDQHGHVQGVDKLMEVVGKVLK